LSKQSGIYKITNNSNRKCYIGKAININNRWQKHISGFNHGKGVNSHFQSAWDKYGEESFSFEILETCETSDNINEILSNKEIYYIQLYKSNQREFGYNKTSGGEGGTQSEESNIRRSLSLKKTLSDPNYKIARSLQVKGENNTFFSKKHSEESKEKMRDVKIGRKLSEEHRNKISLHLINTPPFRGKRHSDETKRKISEKTKGKK
jgi:group I intron endonuclease